MVGAESLPILVLRSVPLSETFLSPGSHYVTAIGLFAR